MQVINNLTMGDFLPPQTATIRKILIMHEYEAENRLNNMKNKSGKPSQCFAEKYDLKIAQVVINFIIFLLFVI